jgi:hypothetical protein
MRIRRKIGGFSTASGALSAEQSFELKYGLGGGFDDDRARRTAWARHRERILAEFSQFPFRRPTAFWEIDVGIMDNFRGDEQKETLLRLGLPLTVAEQQILRKERGV